MSDIPSMLDCCNPEHTGFAGCDPCPDCVIDSYKAEIERLRKKCNQYIDDLAVIKKMFDPTDRFPDASPVWVVNMYRHQTGIDSVWQENRALEEEIKRLRKAMRKAAECWVERHFTYGFEYNREFYIKSFIEHMMEDDDE